MRPCAACSGTGGVGMSCLDCCGTGTDTRPQDWIDQGREAGRQRIARGESLRDVARRLGLRPAEVSAMELGRRDPWRLLQPGVSRG